MIYFINIVAQVWWFRLYWMQDLRCRLGLHLLQYLCVLYAANWRCA